MGVKGNLFLIGLWLVSTISGLRETIVIILYFLIYENCNKKVRIENNIHHNLLNM